MHALVAIAGVLLVGTLSPGPNNLVVMRQAARGGWGAALPAMAGIVAGSAFLLTVVFAASVSTLGAAPQLLAVVTVAGCLYLTFLGGQLIRGGSGAATEAVDRALPAGTAGLFLFQFLNPKAWAITITVVASVPSELGPAALPALIGLAAVISAASLALWGSLGVVITRHRRWPAWRTRFDRALGGLLIGASIALLVGW